MTTSAHLVDVGDRVHFKAGFLRLGNGLRVRGEAYLHLDARVLEVESMRMPLGAVADDGHLLRLDQGKVGVVIVISLSHDDLDFSFCCAGCRDFCQRGDRVTPLGESGRTAAGVRSRSWHSRSSSARASR